MKDQDKTKEQIIKELAELRRRIASVEAQEGERKQAEEDIYKLTQFQQRIIDNVDIWLNVLDDKGNVLVWNKAAEKISGYSKEETIGHSKVWEWAYPEEKYREEIFSKYLEIVAGDAEVEDFKTRIRCKNGEDRTISWISGNLLDEEGNPVGSIALGRDITELKQTEKALEESELIYRTLYDTMAQGVIYRDMNGKFISMNPAAERILGVKAGQINTVETIKDHLKQIHEDGSDYPVEEGPAFLSLRTGQPVNNQVMGVFNKQEGAFRWINISAVPQFRSGEDKPYQVFITFDDITELKQTEEALRESERRYRSAELVGSFGHYTRYLDTNRLVWSEGTYRLFGVDPNKWEPTRDKVAKMVHPKDLDGWIKANEEAERGDKDYNAEFRIIRPDGEERTLHSIANILLDDAGKPERIFGTIVDVTERKKSEEEIQKHRDYLEKLNNSLPEVIINVKRPEKTIEYVNQTVETVFGYKPEKCIGRNTEFLFIDREEFLKAGKDVEDEYGHGKSVMTKQYRYKRKNGEIFPCEVTSSFISENGKLTGFIAVIRDTTERKQAEERERQLQEELTMTSRLASIGEMSAGIAHEINNPLTGVLGFSGLLLQKDLPEDVRKDLNIIYEGAQRVANITRRMLTFARQQKQEKTSVDINDIIETTLEMRTYALNTSNIKLVKQ
ncbi:MAG: PAS domain S-box protein, partial [Candidatus Adiutricales bacterium]